MELLCKLMDIKEPSEITADLLKELVDYVKKKQWIKDRFPENEKEVLIIVEYRHLGKPMTRRVLRAFFEDGLMPANDSNYFWDGLNNGPVPSGWYETTDYGENYEVSNPVMGWQPLPDPWE